MHSYFRSLATSYWVYNIKKLKINISFISKIWFIILTDIIESTNIQLTNSPVNSGFVHTNKSSCLSTNYVENVESKHTPPLIYNNSNKQFVKSPVPPVPPALPIPIYAWRSACNNRDNLPGI